MNFTESRHCPVCDHQGAYLMSIVPVNDDTRYETLRCASCEAVWKFTYQPLNGTKEIIEDPEAYFAEERKVWGHPDPEDDCGCDHEHEHECHCEDGCNCSEDPDHECKCKSDPNHKCKCNHEVAEDAAEVTTEN